MSAGIENGEPDAYNSRTIPFVKPHTIRFELDANGVCSRVFSRVTFSSTHLYINAAYRARAKLFPVRFGQRTIVSCVGYHRSLRQQLSQLPRQPVDVPSKRHTSHSPIYLSQPTTITIG
jgi:hypothetical protein